VGKAVEIAWLSVVNDQRYSICMNKAAIFNYNFWLIWQCWLELENLENMARAVTRAALSIIEAETRCGVH